MKYFKIGLAAATILLIIVFSAINPKKSADALTYDPANELRLAGTVEEVQEFYCPVTQDRGAHLVLRTAEDKSTTVHVGIGRFLREHRVAFSPGERVEVVGANIRYQGQDAVIARQITRGNEVITLRDAAGKPLWQRD